MSVSTKTRVMLWGRSAHLCNFPECKRSLIVDEGNTDDPSLVGEICHIVADKSDGPRGESELTDEQRDRYSNLILLCNIHHKIIDDHPEKYTVDVLLTMKATHERWVRESLQSYDNSKQRDEETYATYVEEWARRVNLESWEDWSSVVMGSGQPSMPKSDYHELRAASTWLFRRIWPKRFPQLEAAFENFRFVLNDFLEVFDLHREEQGDEFWTEKFYRIRDWNPQRYDRLLDEFEFHVDLVMDLTLELTRAANYICDLYRQYIDPMFRIKEGLVLAQSGIDMTLRSRQYRVEYQTSERILHPYPGLEKFKLERRNRDIHYGEGTSIDDPEHKIAGR